MVLALSGVFAAVTVVLFLAIMWLSTAPKILTGEARLAASAEPFTIFIWKTPEDIALRADQGGAGQAYWAAYASYGEAIGPAMVGGAPLNEEFGKAIGADAYCRDAAVAVETAKKFVARKHNQLSAGA